MGQDAALIAPVHLGLGARDHLEPAMQPSQLIRPNPNSAAIRGRACCKYNFTRW